MARDGALAPDLHGGGGARRDGLRPKVSLIIYVFVWLRGTFPRFRYDQLMNIGWKYMIPIAMGAILVGMLPAG